MEIERQKELILMAIRCGFIAGAELTDKGAEGLTTSQWQELNKQKCLIDQNWNNDLVSVLKAIDNT